MRRRKGRTPSRHPPTSSSKLTVASCALEQELESIQKSSSSVLRIRAAGSWVKSLCVCRLDLLFVQPPLPAEPKRGSGPIGVRGGRFPPTQTNTKYFKECPKFLPESQDENVCQPLCIGSWAEPAS